MKTESRGELDFHNNEWRKKAKDSHIALHKWLQAEAPGLMEMYKNRLLVEVSYISALKATDLSKATPAQKRKWRKDATALLPQIRDVLSDHSIHRNAFETLHTWAKNYTDKLEEHIDLLQKGLEELDAMDSSAKAGLKS